jgi:hypothetical protein
VAADELRHRPVPVLLGDRDDSDAMALEAALEHDERGVVAGEAVEAGDEEDVVLAGLGTLD